MIYFAIVAGIVACTGVTLCEATCGELYGNQISQADKQTIVDMHNYLRSLISQGKVPRQPQGKNLRVMTWDNILAKEAQKIANTCEFSHVKVYDQRFSVGQNLGWTSSSAVSGNKEWQAVIQRWFDEHKDFRYPNVSKGVTGHYTQVVWADTHLVGCGFTWYRKNYWHEKLYVCNYGPAGNYIGQPPYRI
ncbi:venom allergen 5-like [Zophobas morio]|uniref:venom allergen 5-like n=1 Tax=Zophobas morio TaxID=2755281 RepID=UPI0030829BAF